MDKLDDVRQELVRSRAFIRGAETQLTKALVALDEATGEKPVEPGPPGSITDLHYDPDTGDLRWTGVDDGTGHPAEYAVRHGSPSLTWGTAYDTEQVIAAVPTGDEIVVTVPTPEAGVRVEYAVVAFRGTLNEDAVFGPVSDVVAVTVKGEIDPDPEPDPDPPTDPGASHEPDGFDVIAIHDGSTLEPGDWDYWKNTHCGGDQGYLEAVNGVLVGHFNKGMGDPCGQRPFTLMHDLHGGRYLYARFQVRLSENWKAHGSSVNKMLYIRSNDTPGNGSPALFIFRGSQDFRPDFLVQNSEFVGGNHTWYRPNLKPDSQIVRGQRYDIQMILGWDRLECWIDGEKTHGYGGEPVFGNEPYGWSSFSWDPVWGGATEVLDRHQTMSVDGFYLSGG